MISSSPAAAKESLSYPLTEDPRIKKLFLTSDGDEDTKRTEEERNRFMNFLTDHHWSKDLLDCSRENRISKTIVCFCTKWKTLSYIDKKVSPAAVTRFLVDTCGIGCASEINGITSKLGSMLKTKCDKDLLYEVDEYF